MPSLSKSQNEQVLVGLRLAIGIGAWLTPRLAGRLFGLDPKANPQSPYLARLFGIRDIALGIGLSQSSGESRKLFIQLGILCDGADALAGLMAGKRGYLNPFATLLVSATAVSAVALGAGLLKAEEDAA